METMSFALKSPIPPAVGTPSTTMSGLFLAVIERTPRMKMLTLSPGLLPAFTMSTPGTRPWIALSAFDVGSSAICAAFTVDTAPVTVRLSCVP